MAGYRRKLIEVALPLVEINDASSHDKMPGSGPHPKSIHKWWAPLPLPSARAVLFASLVDDPSADPAFANQPERVQDKERERLFEILRSLLQKNIHHLPEVFDAAHTEILRSCNGHIPPLLDPFAGSGAIPIEGQRLGLQVFASDLNPIPVIINKVIIEIVPHFIDRKPINPQVQRGTVPTSEWKGANGLAADLRYYGNWILERARLKLEHLYPKAPNGEQVIGWLWTRTVKCPNPACGANMPLLSTFELCTRKGRKTWLEPVIDSGKRTIQFAVRTGNGVAPSPPKIGQGAKFRCVVCGEVSPDQHIKDEGMANRLGVQLTGIIADGGKGRVYYSPSPDHEEVAQSCQPSWRPAGDLANDPRNIWARLYGLLRIADLFSERQLVALTTFSDLIAEVHQQILLDAEGIEEKEEYAVALITLLACVLDRCVDFNNTLCRWKASGEQIIQLFARQAIPMVWDYVEANILGEQAISWYTACNIIAEAVEVVPIGRADPGIVLQVNATDLSHEAASLLISTDPPYYDNISYAGLSDVFYVWLRKSLKELYPNIFTTMLVPKAQELIADPDRFGGGSGARHHFEEGFRGVFTRLKEYLDPRFPLSVYYAFKQSDSAEGGSEKAIDLTTGWETLLEALISSGFQITATWPIRASQAWRLRSMGANALASYIVLACRPRFGNMLLSSRREFVNALKKELPDALHKLQSGNIAPVDLAQASIGPGMAVYSRYSQVLEPNGERLSVRTALQIINQVLDEYLAEQEGDLDTDSRFAVAWFEQYGFREAEFGVADVLARAKNTSVEGLAHAGVLKSGAGKVQLYHWSELGSGWNPATDKRVTTWEATHHLIEQLNSEGEKGAAMLLARMPADLAASARGLAYRLYSICERKGWAEIARDYNALVISWGASQEQAAEIREQYQQGKLF